MAAKVRSGGQKGPAALTADEEIVKEGRDRFKRCDDWEATFRSRYRDDSRFAEGDSDNGFQWPSNIKANRDVDNKPTLTINKTRQFNLEIINEAKQNKPAIKCKPVGDKATFEGAQVMEGIIRHIEYHSRAQDAYDHANTTNVKGGMGYWRVVTDYCDQDTFDQEARIRRIKDPLSVYLDPDISELDGSDARFGFVFEDMPKDEFDTRHPELKGKVGTSNLMESVDWIDEKHVRVCEYWRRQEKKTRLIAFKDPQSGEEKTLREDKIPKEILKPLLADPTTRTRPVISHTVEWFKIAGDQIIERGVWHGSTIPIVRCVAEETVIDGELDRKGHTRNLKDPQRMYNYNSSGSVEFGALQSKTPYIAPAQAIEGYETIWNTANTTNYSVLPYNHLDDDGKAIPPPVRQQPPVMPDSFIKGMAIAAEEMRMVSGQPQSEMGEPSNEQSGRAVWERRRAADKSTFHYIDAQARGVRYTGMILIEIIPKIYDTKRIIKIMGEDGVESEVTIDPTLEGEMQKQEVGRDKYKIIYNPGFAKYAVQAEPGPSFGTRREEAFAAFTKIMALNPDLMKVAGDLMFRAASFPMADELAERLKRMVPAEVLGKGPSPEVQKLLAENKSLTNTIQVMMAEYSELKLKHARGESEDTVKAFDAQTKRMQVLLDRFDPKELAAFTAQLVLEALQTTSVPAKPEAAEAAPAVG